MKIPISKIGKFQMRDIENSRRPHDDYCRICQVVQSKNWHGDLSPLRLSRLFKRYWKDFDKQFVVQVSGCPLDCPFCYVDNLEPNRIVDAKELVRMFALYFDKLDDLNVFHLCGGDPARYSHYWIDIRIELDNAGFKDVILLSDTIFVENRLYGATPWLWAQIPNFALAGCLKGTTRDNFLKNTGVDLFDTAMKELLNYPLLKNFWVSLIEYDPLGLSDLFDIVPFERIDFLKVIEYEATKHRKERI